MMRRLLCGVLLSLLCTLSSAEPAATSGPGRYVDVDGVKLWYEECGVTNGPAVVLPHDGLLHSITWDAVWAPLCAKYHVVRYDRRGYGRSEPSKVRFVPEDDLYQVMRQVHIDRATAGSYRICSVCRRPCADHSCRVAAPPGSSRSAPTL